MTDRLSRYESALRAIAGGNPDLRAWCIEHCEHLRPVYDTRLRRHVAQAALGQATPREWWP